MATGKRPLFIQGVKASGLLSTKNSLIIDIGGGSVESVIIGNQSKLLDGSKASRSAPPAWMEKDSSPYRPYPAQRPSKPWTFILEDTLPDLFDAIKKIPVNDNMIRFFRRI